MHREATIELQKMLSSSDCTTNDIYEVGCRELATLQYDLRRSIEWNIEKDHRGRSYQEFFLEQAMTSNNLFTLHVQNGGQSCLLEVAKNMQCSSFESPVLALGYL